MEKSETPEMEAKRLREALFYAYGANSLEEARRICMCAMSGQLHGLEAPPLKIIPDNKVPPGMIEIRHPDGRVDRIRTSYP